jgi:hypothetical protein
MSGKAVFRTFVKGRVVANYYSTRGTGFRLCGGWWWVELWAGKRVLSVGILHREGCRCKVCVLDALFTGVS